MNTSRSHRSLTRAASDGKADGSAPSRETGVDRSRGAESSSVPAAATSCLGFVNDLARLAERARQADPADEDRRRLAGELIYRYVPGTTIFGVRVRRFIVGPVAVEERVDRSSNVWGPDGFRPSLICGGQDEEVVRHVAAAAACVLVRRVYLVRVASLYDWVQGLFRGRAEAKAEIAGNRAGLRVGRVLADYVGGRLDVSRLRAVLGAILCE